MAKNNYPCPCFSGKLYTECCELVHKDKVTNPTVEQVARARYTAFCYGNIGYLVDTLHPKRRRFGTSFSLSRQVRRTHWVGLKVLGHEKEDDVVSYVDSVAFHIKFGEMAQQRERAKYVFINDKWYYFDGEPLPAIKLEPNAPCFCGSGKKYKKCHGTLADKLAAEAQRS